MARTREFDTEAAVEAAMGVFWRKGYAATSIHDLVEATGVGRGSLYAAFGSKQGLYEAALTRYAERSGAANTARLERVAPVREILRGLLLALVDATVLDPERRGCLITNTATERLPHDPMAARVVGQALDRQAESVTAVLRRARDEGELPPGTDVTSLADLVVTTVQGVRVLGKAGADRRRLVAVVDLALSVLPVKD
ncbi:TetR family transcriptional regulator [Nonomuraea sp. NPDC050536]|uniref:TetR family transcriptional regulator n=1 Tax=Nonomuraea sp. NPDC050536 TaxID=3364366 RepID=UPI0037C7F9AA